MIITNIKQMNQLIDGLLALSHLDRQPITKQKVALESIVNQVIQEMQPDLEGRKLDFHVADLPIRQVDPILFKQVFVNLISNAVKFTRQQELGKIEIGYHSSGEIYSAPNLLGKLPSTEQPTGWAGGVFFIRDNGVGFDMHYVDKLFGVFQRLHRADEYEGVGIGLAIVSRIINRHGGQIWADSVAGQGATFFFTIGVVET
jgi:light-regulated signal transduction histidine kinase (bacteriophytochrome)